MNFVVIGAGPTGLGFLYRLHELGRLRSDDHVVILESGAEVGGLAHSVQDPHGFWWDMGGHVTFSHYHYFTNIIDRAIRESGNGWSDCRRASYVHLQDRFIGYPLQNNVHCLDEPERGRCIEGLARKPCLKPTNFDEWILTNFGEALADIFMRPYNRKVWTVDPRDMNHVWVGERVAVPSVEEIRAKLERGAQDTGWGPNATFRFPLHGGTGAVWKGVARLIPPGMIRLNNTVTDVNLGTSTVSVVDSTGARHTLPFDALVNTSPLDTFLRIISDCDPQIQALADSFVHSRVHVVGVGMRGEPPPLLAEKTWMYFPDPAVPFYRMTVFSNYSPHNAPPGCWSLMVECSEGMGAPRQPAEAVIEACVSALARLGFVQPDQIVSRFHQALERGYPVPFLKRDEVLGRVNAHLEGHRVFSRGRFGGWKYEVANQDHSFMQGVELADGILFGVPELTYAEPDYVNAKVRMGRRPLSTDSRVRAPKIASSGPTAGLS